MHRRLVPITQRLQPGPASPALKPGRQQEGGSKLPQAERQHAPAAPRPARPPPRTARPGWSPAGAARPAWHPGSPWRRASPSGPGSALACGAGGAGERCQPWVRLEGVVGSAACRCRSAIVHQRRASLRHAPGAPAWCPPSGGSAAAPGSWGGARWRGGTRPAPAVPACRSARWGSAACKGRPASPRQAAGAGRAATMGPKAAAPAAHQQRDLAKVRLALGQRVDQRLRGQHQHVRLLRGGVEGRSTG